MVERNDNVAVASKLRVGGVVALVVAERAVRENDEREIALSSVGLVEMRGNLGAGAVVFEGIDAALVNKDSVRLLYGKLARYRQTVVV